MTRLLDTSDPDSFGALIQQAMIIARYSKGAVGFFDLLRLDPVDWLIVNAATESAASLEDRIMKETTNK